MPVVECSLHETIEVQFAHQSVLKEANWDIFGPKKSLCEIQTRKQGDQQTKHTRCTRFTTKYWLTRSSGVSHMVVGKKESQAALVDKRPNGTGQAKEKTIWSPNQHKKMLNTMNTLQILCWLQKNWLSRGSGENHMIVWRKERKTVISRAGQEAKSDIGGQRKDSIKFKQEKRVVSKEHALDATCWLWQTDLRELLGKARWSPGHQLPPWQRRTEGHRHQHSPPLVPFLCLFLNFLVMARHIYTTATQKTTFLLFIGMKPFQTTDFQYNKPQGETHYQQGKISFSQY